jgi:hypothetical protein
MTVEIHTLSWPNTNTDMITAHQNVCRHLDLNVNYTFQQIRHGQWINDIMNNSTSDVVGFLDNDCVPTNRKVVDDAIIWAANNKSFVGTAQVSNWRSTKAHIFASPAFFFIWRETWKSMQCPTFLESENADVAENVSHTADIMNIPYKALYPTHHCVPSHEGLWKLHNYGWFGIGTHYEGGVFHLYQGRMEKNVKLFVDRCNDIIAGNFTTEGMNSSRM